MGSNHTLRPSEGGTVTRGSPANRDALRALLKPETTAWKYNHGVPDNDGGLAERVLARQFLNLPARRGQGATRPVRRLQEQRRALSDLPGVYPDWPHRTETTHSSCRRGRGVQARHDIPNATVRFFDTRHFAPETHAPEVAAAIRGFLP